MASREGSALARLRPLDPSASTPLWRQLKQALRDLAMFSLEPGDRIPSEAELCAHYGLSRVTVRQAITSLANSGVLHRQHGRGTFVLPRRTSAPLADAGRFLDSSFEAAPREAVTLFSAETVPADERVARRLRTAPGEPLHKVRVVLRHGDEPGAYRVAWVPSRLAPNLLQCDLHEPIHPLLERVFGLCLAIAEEAVECVAADEFRAEILEVPLNSALLVVEWQVSTIAEQPVVFSRAYYRSDRYVLRRRLARAGVIPPHEDRRVTSSPGAIQAGV